MDSTYIYDSVKGNCVRVTATELLLFFFKVNVDWFYSIGTLLLLLPKLSCDDALMHAFKSSNLT